MDVRKKHCVGKDLLAFVVAVEMSAAEGAPAVVMVEEEAEESDT